MSRKRRTLRPDEEELWKRVAETATPLRPDVPNPKVAFELANVRPKAKKVTVQPFSFGEKIIQKPARHDFASSIGEDLSKAPLQMDEKAFGKLKRGKLSPEARIDLHGMTIAQAHPVLTGFILNAHASRKRLVLVVTGKGKSAIDDGPIPVRRGVLKHQVPHWLHSAPLRQVVLQVSEAHLKHGGSGAYYVYLKRHR
ncbi:Smr/MutS family protein [Pseudohalocynthiibacter aestuariivivens]|uniref:Smr/MutS family protein n=1 Tax=Pseudohalocynthiibacter aestuariivivens TaxID=1591409 RepID=A0ABV5JK08_9RHOB|nr:Smr/MutS family protein [Pseudohalocynthiibacter aestuariivivens]MBS9717668.1 Smr/MutS family protein [Pseudohalocynthiibacter aestuariivivens]